MEVQFVENNVLISLPWPPPPEKDEIKQLGAKWDAANKLWRMPLSSLIIRWLDDHDVALPDGIIAARDENLAASRASDADISVPAPEGMTFRPFQIAGVAWGLKHQGAFIGDDMGLGKTIQALGVINADPEMGSALIVCPLSVALNWKSEAEKWLVRDMTIGVATGKEWPETDMVIAHWGIISKHAQTIRSRQWDLVVLDEAHYAKNPRAGRTKAIIGDRVANLKPLEAKRRIALSGTPIPNRPIEIYPLLKWLAPIEFDNWATFATRYCAGYKTQFGWDVSGASNLDELQERLRSVVMIRRLKKDVLPELPPKTRQVILFSPDSADARKALSSEKKTSAEIGKTLAEARAALELAKAESEEDYQRAVKGLHTAQGVAFTEMSQARHATAVAKIPQVLEHVKDVLANDGQKVVLFAHHRDVIDSLRNGLETASGEWSGVETVSIVGGDSAEHRQEVVHSFQTDPRARVFLGSIGAAKEGITLTAANVAIFAEIDWVPGNMSQAEDRIFRIGQVDSVSIQHVLLDGSLDATMIKTIVRKQEVIEQALDNPFEKKREVHSPETDETEQEIVEAGENFRAATKNTSREEIAKRASLITENEIDLVHQGLRLLAFHDTDGARVVNDVGFSKIDVQIGHQLADLAELSPKQAALGAKLVAKYHRQIPQEIAEVWKALGKRDEEEVQTMEVDTDDDQSQVQAFGMRRR